MLAGLVLGGVVLWANPQRRVNRAFMGLSLLLTFYLLLLGLGFRSLDAVAITRFIRWSSALSVWVVAAVNMLRLELRNRPPRAGFDLREHVVVVLICGGLTLICLLGGQAFLRGVVLSPGASGSQAEPQYGPLQGVYGLGMAGLFLYVMVQFVRDTKRARGLQRVESQFFLLGFALGMFCGVMLGIVLPLVTRTSSWVQLQPLSILLWQGVISYGMATHQIMDVRRVVRVYSGVVLLTVALCLIYVGVWFFVDLLTPEPLFMSGWHMLLALLTALAALPLYRVLQAAMSYVIPQSRSANFHQTMSHAGERLLEVTTTDELFHRLIELTATVLQTKTAIIYVRNRDRFEIINTEYPAGLPAHLDADDPFVLALDNHQQPLVRDALSRRRMSPSIAQAVQAMTTWGVGLAAGVRSTSHQLRVLMLLPDRSGETVFTALDAEQLHLMADRVAAALENARLYSDLQTAKIYNDILLDQLVCGVLAVDRSFIITACNAEARTLFQLPEHPEFEQLPRRMQDILQQTLTQNSVSRNIERTFDTADGRSVPVRLGAACFYDAKGEVLGALAVCTDLSALRRLEQRVRDADRLASIGTLAAGLAHEIKNPLVSIHTFVQLLPQRYQDAEFRETFTSLVGDEVRRIDGLVNRLLDLSRPIRPEFEQVSVHALLRDITGLLSERMTQCHTQLETNFAAHCDEVWADQNQLRQVFMNVFVNAMEAMGTGGCIRVSTGEEPEDLGSGRMGLHVEIQDTGPGIPEEQLGRIFDPFFTTKADGTGLGLAVAHGVIHEHGGVLQVESALHKGCTFHILLPFHGGVSQE